VLVEACVLALVALAIPHARSRGLWGAALLGGTMILLTVAAVPGAAPVPLVVSAWVIAAFTALRSHPLGVPSAPV